MYDAGKVEVNVEEIMRAIRRKIQMEEEAESLPSFESIPLRGERGQPDVVQTQMDWPLFMESLGYVNLNYDIPYYWSFGPNSIKTFLKRVVRKLVKCILPPILAKQNMMNANFVRCLNQLRCFVEDTCAQGAKWSRDLETIREGQRDSTEKLRELESHYEEQQLEQEKKLKHLSHQLDEMQKQMARGQELFEEQLASLEDQLHGLEEQNRALEERSHALEDQSRGLEEMYRLSMADQEQMRGQLQWLEQEGILPPTLAKPYIQQYVSQSGEDIIVSHILKVFGIKKSECSYLDLGANHAKTMNNTYNFYQNGASGVLVEANPALIRELKLYRSRDIILNRCIAVQGGQPMAFYILNGDGLSTPDRAQAEQAIKINPNLKIEKTVNVESITVNEIMDTYFDGAPVFMNLDIEGEEMNILESIDFEAHRPMLISIEMIPYRTNIVIGNKNPDILAFMARNDYVEYAFTGINSIFIDKRQINVTGWDLQSVQELLISCGKPIDCIPYAQINEFAERRKDQVELFPGGIVYGPYITLPQGDYVLKINVSLNGLERPLSITSDNGTQVVEEQILSDGENVVRFRLPEEQRGVEFVLKNDTDKNMCLFKLLLQTDRTLE